MNETGLAEVARRQALEERKALEKYGEDALRSGGHPDYDITDYALNELVGLIRYGEMIAERANELRGTLGPDHDMYLVLMRAVNALEELGERISNQGETLGAELADIREALLKTGVELGEPEHD